MGLAYLDQVLKPSSIAVIGASNLPQRPGNIVMRNLLQGGFDGPIMPVTPNYKSVCGVLAYRSIDELPQVPDLCIICTRATRVPAILLQLGRKGARAVIVIAAGLDKLHTAQGTNLLELMQAQARQWDMRILGPNSLGLLVPRLGLNASYAQTEALPGKIAVLAQSTSVCVTLLDWARQRGIGFSHVVDLGDAQDLGFADMLDYLGRDPHTQAILLYVDKITDGRRFMSAARAAALTKPLLVIKTGRTLETQWLLNATAVATPDEIYDAAFKRAGMLRVNDLRELLVAVETLANGKAIFSEQVVIVSNGDAPAAMAMDVLSARGGRLQQLPESLIEELRGYVHAGARLSNPINLLGDATPADYQRVLEHLLKGKLADNILVLHSPSALIPSAAYAEAVVATLAEYRARKPNVFVSWLGEAAAQAARQQFASAGIASYRTPENAASAFMHMVQYRRNQKLLQETPDAVLDAVAHQPEAARVIIVKARAAQTALISRTQAADLLHAYGIARLPSREAASLEELAAAAQSLRFPVALKLNLPPTRDSKTDLGAVILNLNSLDEVLEAARLAEARVAAALGKEALQGFTLQSMAKRQGALQLRIDVRTDPVFGPVIYVGESLAHWRPAAHAAVGLLPLNMALARYLIIQALAEGKIRERDEPIDRQILAQLLVRVSQLIIEQPEIDWLQINPLLLDAEGARVLDVQVGLVQDGVRAPLAIRPYPNELEQRATLKSGETILLRPLKPEDEIRLQLFDQQQTKEDRYKRYFGEMPQFSHEQMVRLTQLDYDREMAFIALREDAPDATAILGVVRMQQEPDNSSGEFAMAIRSDHKGQGLGTLLLGSMIEYARGRGLAALKGMTMIENSGMAHLARKLGFNVRFNREDEVIEMHLPFTADAPAAD